MTNNEAISRIKFLLDVGGSDGFTSSDEEALNMAINALADETTAPPKSNGDRIRAMTDEELSTVLRCNSCVYQNRSECETSDCEYGIIAWLQKEADEDAGTD